jgi:hypothetical protein
LDSEPFPTSLFLFAGLSAVIATAVVAAILYRVLELARDRYEISSGLSQLAQISWHELQVLIGMGLRSRGLAAVSGGDHDDHKVGAADLMLSDGKGLQLLRVKHGGGIQVDDHTIFDLATRRDARRAGSAMIATTGKVSRIGDQAAKEAGITVIAGLELWSLVSDHLPPRLRERIANRRRATLRNRIGVLIGSSALAGAGALALVFHLARADLIFADPKSAPTVAVTAPAAPVAAPVASAERPPASSATEPASAPVASTPVAQPTPTPPEARAPLDDAALQERRREVVKLVRTIGAVTTVRWSTASTLEVELQPDADLQDDSMFDRVCTILRETEEELRLTRVQLQLKDGDPSKGLTTRWRQCT